MVEWWNSAILLAKKIERIGKLEEKDENQKPRLHYT